MRIELLFFAGIKEALWQTQRFMDVEDGVSIHEVVQLLSAETKELLFQTAPLVFAVNENFESGDYRMKSADRLAIMTPMAGG